MNKEEKSVYIHIPFCNSICTYCDFCILYYNKKWVKKYLNALKSEIEDRYLGEEVATLYIGGGTPSALKKEELISLLKLTKLFNLNHLKEFTFECNLSDITSELISILLQYKVNRLSIGIESFNQNNLDFMNRHASFNDALEKIKMCKKMGLTNINADLIYAIPFEKLSTLKKDLRLFNKLGVNHISTYSLMIEKNTILSYKKTEPISEDLDAKMYFTICHYLKRKKYVHYEVSNFAKKGYFSEHNLSYWNNAEYYGFGLGASGYIDGVRYDNTRNLTKYLKKEYVLNKEILSEQDKMDYELILGLRKCIGISIREFYDKYHVNIQNKYPIEELLNTKELIYKNGNIFINPAKIYVMNDILTKLV